jgi:hypothetical protein
MKYTVCSNIPRAENGLKESMQNTVFPVLPDLRRAINNGFVLHDAGGNLFWQLF